MDLIKTLNLSKHLLQICLFFRNTDLRLAADTCYACNHRPLFSPREQSEAQHCLKGFSLCSSLPSSITFKVVLGLFSPVLLSSPKKPLHQICIQLASKGRQKHTHTIWVWSELDSIILVGTSNFEYSVNLGLCMFLIALWNTSCKKGNCTCKSLHLTLAFCAMRSPYHSHVCENAQPLPHLPLCGYEIWHENANRAASLLNPTHREDARSTVTGRLHFTVQFCLLYSRWGMVQQDTVQADQAAQPGIPTNAQTGLLRACTLGMGGNTVSPLFHPIIATTTMR